MSVCVRHPKIPRRFGMGFPEMWDLPAGLFPLKATSPFSRATAVMAIYQL